jgi:hypothetical protein
MLLARFVAARQLFAQALACCRVLSRRTLPLDIATLQGGLVENVIGRLDQSRGLKFT